MDNNFNSYSNYDSNKKGGAGKIILIALLIIVLTLCTCFCLGVGIITLIGANSIKEMTEYEEVDKQLAEEINNANLDLDLNIEEYSGEDFVETNLNSKLSNLILTDIEYEELKSIYSIEEAFSESDVIGMFSDRHIAETYLPFKGYTFQEINGAGIGAIQRQSTDLSTIATLKNIDLQILNEISLIEKVPDEYYYGSTDWSLEQFELDYKLDISAESYMTFMVDNVFKTDADLIDCYTVPLYNNSIDEQAFISVIEYVDNYRMVVVIWENENNPRNSIQYASLESSELISDEHFKYLVNYFIRGLHGLSIDKYSENISLQY